MVKPGYKQTEVGIIPEAWDISSLAAAFPKLEAGVSVNSDNTLSSEYHVLKTSAVHDGVVDVAETKPIVPQDYHRVKCPLVKGSMVISRMNTPALVGECGFVKNAKDGTYLPDRLWQVKNPPGSSFDFEWLNYLLNTKQYRDAVRATATGTSNSMKNISKERLLEIKIPHPPFDEQQHIAEILSNLDELIHLIEQQISKKKAIKQGAMQELLTGEKRLPGFSGEWQYMELGKYGTLLRESINPQLFPCDYFWEYSMPAFDNEKIPVKQIGSDMHSNRTVIYGKVLLFNKLNVRQKRIWMINQCRNRAVCSSEFLPYQSNKINLELLAQILNTDKVTLQFVGMSTGTSNSQKRITPNDFLEYKVYLPIDVDEQSAIAEVLVCMDKEIEALEKKLAKYRQVKQGMMQQLLTGKIRLV